DDGLGLAHGLIVGPAIDVAAPVLVVRVADEGRGEVDRRHHGTAWFVDPGQRLHNDRSSGPPLPEALGRSRGLLVFVGKSRVSGGRGGPRTAPAGWSRG